MLKWDYKSYFEPGDFHTVVISPPCTEYSSALTTRERDLQGADRLVLRALEIKDYLQPERWWLENPRYGLLKSRDFMAGYPYIDVDYCQYADWGYKKPTRIWGSPDILQVKARLCDGKSCPNLCPGPQGVPRKHRICLSSKHQNASPAKKYRIPEALVQDLIWVHSSQDCLAMAGGITAQADSGAVAQSLTVVLPVRLEEAPGIRSLDQVSEVGGHRQLLIVAQATGTDGYPFSLSILIDTGAEANLVKRGLVRECLFRHSDRPLTLTTASGSLLFGSKREADLS